METIWTSVHLIVAPPGGREEKDCICPRCPSYPDCAVDPYLRLFCMKERAPCAVQGRGCTCPVCKVHTEHHFTRDFYCDVGTDDEQERMDH